MTYKLTSDAIITSFLSAGCRVSFSTPPLGVSHTIEGRPDEIRNAITSIIEAAMLDLQAAHDQTKKDQQDWRAHHNAQYSAQMKSFDAMCSDAQLTINSLRQQLAAARNDVKQLREALDKRDHPLIGTTWKVVGYHDRRTTETQADGTVLLHDPVTGKAWTADGVRVERKTVTAQDAISEVMAAMHEDEGAPQPKKSQYRGSFLANLDFGAMMDREFEKVRAACRKNDESINDGWIECKYLPINQWCDVKRADGTTDRVCRPEVRGVQQAAEITHYRPIKKESKPREDDGWIAWQSIVWSDCPVEPGTPVIVRYRDGTVSGVLGAMKRQKDGERDASVSYWFRHGFDNDIVAYKLAPKAADNDGWIEWHGGECPVLNGVRVDVQYRCGESARNVPANMSADAGEACWLKRGYMYDIIAYRLAK